MTLTSVINMKVCIKLYRDENECNYKDDWKQNDIFKLPLNILILWMFTYANIRYFIYLNKGLAIWDRKFKSRRVYSFWTLFMSNTHSFIFTFILQTIYIYVLVLNVRNIPAAEYFDQIEKSGHSLHDYLYQIILFKLL